MKTINRFIQVSIFLGISTFASAQDWNTNGNSIAGGEWFGGQATSIIPVSFEHQANSAISRFEWSTTNGTLQERMRLTQLGFLGLNTTNPASRFHMVDGGMTLSGTVGANPDLGAGTRMMWIPSLGAFRAGSVSGAQWDNPNVGVGSVAMGINTQSIGEASVAMGISSQASGYASVALGMFNASLGDNSFTHGAQNIADGLLSGAIGHDVHATGNFSYGFGRQIKFTAEGSITIGSGPVGLPANLTNTIANSFLIGMNSNLPTFFISPSAGFGTFGRVGLGNITAPIHLLDVNGNARFRELADSVPDVLITGVEQTGPGDYELNHLPFSTNATDVLTGEGNWTAINTIEPL